MTKSLYVLGCVARGLLIAVFLAAAIPFGILLLLVEAAIYGNSGEIR